MEASGGIWAALGAQGTARRHPGGYQETTRRPPEAPRNKKATKKHPETPKRQPGDQGVFEIKCLKTIVEVTRPTIFAQTGAT